MAGFAGIYSNASSKPWTQDSEYDPSRYQYGGYAGGAGNQAANYGNQATSAEQRAAPTMGTTQLNQGAADQSRAFQMGSLASLQSAASGGQPSQAEILGKQMDDANARAAVSAAGTVRGGPGAQASAYRYAANNAATQGAQNAQSVMATRANEMATARGQLADASSSARGQDLNAATTNATLANDANKTNAANQLQQTSLNDNRSLAYDQLGNQVNEDQLNANLQQQQIAAGVRQNGDALNAQTNQANTNTNKGILAGIAGVGQGVLSAIPKAFDLSDPNSKMPVMGSLATLGLGGQRGGFGGGEDLGDTGGRITLGASTGLGSPQAIKGMVGGGGIFGGVKPVGEGSVSSPAMMTSDGDAKEPAGSLLGEVLKGAAGAHPYDRNPEISNGFGGAKYGAPRGYASGRSAPEEDSVSWSKPETWGMNKKTKSAPSTEGQAPGSNDWQRYGKSAADAKDDEIDWNNGGSVAKKDAKPGVLELLLTGIGGARPFGSRDLTTSDPAAKRAVYFQGREHGAQSVRNGESVPYAFKPLSDDEELVEVKPGQAEIRKKDGQQAPPSKKIDLTQHAPGVVRAITDGEIDRRATEGAAGTAAGVSAAVAARNGAPFAGLKTTTLAPVTKDANTRAEMTSDPKTKAEFGTVPDADMAEAMRSMTPSAYEYKPSFAGQNGQMPGEVNIGPMANAMAKDPVARTAIVRDPQSGMLAIDKSKAEKVIMGSLASLQHQIDELGQNDVPRAVRAKKQRRDEAAHA